MEYIYAALLLHRAGKPVDEENVKKVLSAAGVNPDEARVKSLVAALSEVNIDEVLKSATAMPVAAAPAPAPEAEKKLYQRKDFIANVPDILANAGGVVMSYLEWVENLQWYFWDEEETRNKLAAIMRKNFIRTADRWEKLKGEHPDKLVTMRDAAFVLAVERVYRAMKLRGWL